MGMDTDTCRVGLITGIKDAGAGGGVETGFVSCALGNRLVDTKVMGLRD